MSQWLNVLICLLMECYATRRDAQIRFLGEEELQILRKKTKRNRVIVDSEDRWHLLRLASNKKLRFSKDDPSPGTNVICEARVGVSDDQIP